ncbi:N-acetylmuramoyl-L-alanine amidase [Clostridium mediterraneense]|uniref:N-acetylmuramoyl-L-alanine amidase n=1 Tax=Clostridium mediterraneense TaxID=1805472 RepID=UPI00082CABD4|nr:N-acetylmuramoyl-L-alanine amidase [Clostridium mediterraneense]
MIKKIAVRGGHNFQATGASALIDETTEDRKVKDSLIQALRSKGYDVIDVTPGDCDVLTDLELGVNKAEDFDADLFISVHFDKAYDHYEGALGHACWIYGQGGQAEVISNRIVKTVVDGTGFKNRGVRINPDLYELRKTSMPAIIVETCFCEATEDVAIYKEKGAELIGQLIADGIAGEDTQVIESSNNLVNNDKYAIVTASILNVRSGAGLEYPVIGQVKQGDKIKLDCKVGQWWSTYYGEHGGFMYADYLKEY